MHHLTYERAGEELPEDLQHICIQCHMEAHPKKSWEILVWESQRQARIAAACGEEVEIETEEEQIRLEEHEEEQRQAQPAIEEPAWNLGHYTASGYCLEDVEQEEMDRAHDNWLSGKKA